MAGRKRDDAWRYFEEVANGNKKEYVCCFCKEKFCGQNITKKKEHLSSSCPNASKEAKEKFRKVKNGDVHQQGELNIVENTSVTSDEDILRIAAKIKKQLSQSQVKESSIPSCSNSNANANNNPTRLQLRVDSMSKVEQKELNALLAHAIYTSGQEFSIFQSDEWKTFFKKLRPSYVLPCRQTLSESYLEREYEDMKRIVEEAIAEKEVLHLQEDGWSSIRMESIINYIITTPEPFYVHGLNCGANHHTATFLAIETERILLKYGVEKFCCLMADNAHNVQKGHKILQVKYPHLILLGCIAHSLHLLVGTFFKTKALKNILDKVVNVIKTIKRSHPLTGVFLQKQRELNQNAKDTVSLHLPGNTRWGSSLFCLESFEKCKTVLKQLVISEEAGLDHDLEKINMRNDILDENLWKNVGNVIEILKPIITLITLLETDIAQIHTVNSDLKKMEKKVKAAILKCSFLTFEEKLKLGSDVDSRKKKIIQPIHWAAEMLDPLNRGENLTEEERLKAIELIIQQAAKVETLPDNTVKGDLSKPKKQNVVIDLTNFTTQKGIYGKKVVNELAETLSPLQWWENFFSQTDLGRAARKILTAPVTSAQTERSFSCYSHIHNKKRNRLLNDKAAKLTYIFLNSKYEKAAKARKNAIRRNPKDENKEELELAELEADRECEAIVANIANEYEELLQAECLEGNDYIESFSFKNMEEEVGEENELSHSYGNFEENDYQAAGVENLEENAGGHFEENEQGQEGEDLINGKEHESHATKNENEKTSSCPLTITENLVNALKMSKEKKLKITTASQRSFILEYKGKDLEGRDAIIYSEI